ncbi:MAG: ABC transporter ATP-binding protein [Lachnospiraceae bacterium]|nr:ABC transporter ATP-binding protein [Lachnospiraceae bacterium]
MFSVKNITMIYDIEKENKMYALGGFDMELPDTGLIGFIGPSGSGKSTLMYCLSTLKKPTAGEILYNGRDIINIKNSEQENLRRKEFGFVFQRHFLIPYMPAVDNVVIAMDENNTKAREKAAGLLKELGLSGRELGKRPSKLSGGQRQRVAIARAMANRPSVLFADEPTAALDHENAFSVMRVLKEYSKKHLVLVITHDISILKDADQIIEMWDGMIGAVKGGEGN